MTYAYEASLDVTESYVWAMSSKDRNQEMHARVGNGPAAHRKRRPTAPPPPDLEADLGSEVLGQELPEAPPTGQRASARAEPIEPPSVRLGSKAPPALPPPASTARGSPTRPLEPITNGMAVAPGSLIPVRVEGFVPRAAGEQELRVVRPFSMFVQLGKKTTVEGLTTMALTRAKEWGAEVDDDYIACLYPSPSGLMNELDPGDIAVGIL